MAGEICIIMLYFTTNHGVMECCIEFVVALEEAHLDLYVRRSARMGGIDMSLQFFLGGPGTGKTYTLFDTIIRQSMEQPGNLFLIIVPEQFTLQTQKEIVRMHPRRGVMNIDIVSFQRLAYRIFEELSMECLPILDDMGKSMVLRKVAADKKNELRLFGGHLNQNGFINQLKSMLSEFYQYGIEPDQLRKLGLAGESDLLREKLKDLTILYEGFQSYLEKKYITTEEILEALCRVLPNSRLIKQSVIALDGYTGFTPVQYQLLGLFLKYSPKVMLTITMDVRENPYKRAARQHLFYMSKQMACKMVDLASWNQIIKEEDICFYKKKPDEAAANYPALAFLEQGLFRYASDVYEADQDEIFIYQGNNPADEVFFVVNQVFCQMKEFGYRYRDMAVITGDLNNYGMAIIHQFKQSGIPYFMDDKKSILENPFVEYIRAALDVLNLDFSYESMFRYLKTGLAGINHEEIGILENYVTALGIRGFKRWNMQWERTYRGNPYLNLEQLNQTREQILLPFQKLREVIPRSGAKIQERIEALRDFLDIMGLKQKLIEYQLYFNEKNEYRLAEEYGQIYDLVMDLFERICQLLGDETVGRKEFKEILDAGFAEIRVGTIPAAVDRIVVGDITRTRLDHIKVLFFVGVNEGLVPSKKGSGGLLTDAERNVLGSCKLELAPTSQEDGFMQRYYLYLILAKPECRLYLTYANLSAAGKSLRPSTLIGEVRRLFPNLSIKNSGSGFKAYARTVGEKRLIQGLQRYRESMENPEFLELYRWFTKDPETREKVERLLEAVFFSYVDQGIGAAVARELYGTILQGSVTRMEQYAACAYAQFLKFGLELTQRQEYELASVDIGNLFHNAIDQMFREMKTQNRSFADLTDDLREKMVHDCVIQIAQSYGNTIMQSSARYAYLTEKVERITDRTIWALTEQIKKGDFVPTGFEVSFSAIDHLAAMKIALSPEEQLHLRGRIDRMDQYEDEEHVYLKIIDYKSGSTSFDLAALYYGLQLQLVVYMDAAMELEQRKHKDKQVVPAGIFYYHIDDPMLEKKGEMTQQEIDVQILKKLRMDGLVNRDLEVIRHLDHDIEKESHVIPVTLKDGNIQDSKSSVASEARFDCLRRFVREKLEREGREILSGKIKINPYKQGNRTACDYCPYHGVCGFDLKTAGYAFHKFNKQKPEEIWAEIDPEESEVH